MALMGLKVNPETLVMGAERIRAMDEQGIDVEALSINAFWYKADRDLARQLIKLQNEKLAALCAAQPDRFVAFASVALQHPGPGRRAARRRREEAPGCAAAAIGGSVERRGAGRSGSFIRSGPRRRNSAAWCSSIRRANPDFEKRLKGNGGLINVIGNPLETTIALSHLIFEGTLDRFPGLKVCAAHGGGYLPSYAARSDAGCTTFPERCSAVQIKKKPTEYLRQLYFDSIVFTPQALRHLVAEVGAEPDRHGDGLSIPLDQDLGRPHPQHARPQRCRPRGDAGRHRCETAGDQVGTQRDPPCDGRAVVCCRWRAWPPSSRRSRGWRRRKPIRRVRCASSSASRRRPERHPRTG